MLNSKKIISLFVYIFHFTHKNIAFYFDHSRNKVLSYTNIQQISSIYLIFLWN